MADTNEYVRWLDDLINDDVPVVGGKNASLGEMIQSLKEEGVRVPGGFATTADAYREFLRANDLDEQLKHELAKLNNDEQSLDKSGKSIRQMIRNGWLLILGVSLIPALVGAFLPGVRFYSSMRDEER